MFNALASTRDYNLLKLLILNYVKLSYFHLFISNLSLLAQTSNTSVIKKQDETSIVRSIILNPAGRDLVWDHFVLNWNGYIER